MKKNSAAWIATILILAFALPSLATKVEIQDGLPSDVKIKSKKRRVVDSDEGEQVRTKYKEAETGEEIRKMRRMAFGVQGAGALGLGGVIMELNFSPKWSFGVGYGGGEGYQAFKIEGKYVLSGDWVMPYMSFGYAHWASLSKGGYIHKTNPSLLADRLLNDDQKAAGQFEENLLYPAIGLQFMQLTGEWAGASAFAEITVLLDIGNFVAAPTGTIGMLYYF